MTPVAVDADVSGLDFVTTFQQAFGSTRMSVPANRAGPGADLRRAR